MEIADIFSKIRVELQVNFKYKWWKQMEHLIGKDLLKSKDKHTCPNRIKFLSLSNSSIDFSFD